MAKNNELLDGQIVFNSWFQFTDSDDDNQSDSEPSDNIQFDIFNADWDIK